MRGSELPPSLSERGISSCKKPVRERAAQPGCSSQALRRSRRAEGGRRSPASNGNLLTRFYALAGALAAEVDVDDAIIDGEVIAADEMADRSFTISSAARGCRPMSRSISSG